MLHLSLDDPDPAPFEFMLPSDFELVLACSSWIASVLIYSNQNRIFGLHSLKQIPGGMELSIHFAVQAYVHLP